MNTAAFDPEREQGMQGFPGSRGPDPTEDVEVDGEVQPRQQQEQEQQQNNEATDEGRAHNEVVELEYWSFINRGLQGSVERSFSSSKLARAHLVGTLNLQGNQLTSLSGISDFQALRRLNIASNDVRNVEASDLAGLSHLLFLSLASNLLVSLPAGCLPPLASLCELDLSYNAIEDVEGLSVLGQLEILNLRQNRIGTISALEPLRLCVGLSKLLLENNPVCTTTRQLSQNVRNILPQVREMDIDVDAETALVVSPGVRRGRHATQDAHVGISPSSPPHPPSFSSILPLDVANSATSNAPELPRFQRAAELFLRRMERSQIRENTDSPPRKGKGFHNPWAVEPASNDRIIHTRILRQRMLSDAQHAQILADWHANNARRPSDVLQEWAGSRKLARSISLEDGEFQDLLRSGGVEVSKRQIARFRRAGRRDESLKVGHLVETLVLLRREAGRRARSGSDEAKTGAAEVVEETSTGDSISVSPANVGTIESEMSSAVRSEGDTDNSSVKDEISDDDDDNDDDKENDDEDVENAASQSKKKCTPQARADSPIDRNDTNGRKEDVEECTDEEAVEQRNQIIGPTGDMDLKKTANASTDTSTTQDSSASLLRLQNVSDGREQQQAQQQQQQQQEFFLAELSLLRQRLESHEQEAWRQRFERLEQTSLAANERVLAELENKLAATQEELRHVRASKEAESVVSAKAAQDKLRALEADLDSSRSALAAKSQEAASLAEKLEVALQEKRSLTQRLSHFQESSTLTQDQLAGRADALAAKLAISESRREEHAAEARNRAAEALALEQRVGAVLEEAQHLRQALDFAKENAQKTHTRATEEKRAMARQLEEAEVAAREGARHQADLQKLLDAEREQTASKELRLQRVCLELQGALRVIREQKQKLERLIGVVRTRDNELAEARAKISEMASQHAEEIASIRLETRSLERRVKDVDEARADALRAQAEADVAREEVRRVTAAAAAVRQGLEHELEEARDAIRVKEAMLRDQNESLAEMRRAASDQSEFERALEKAERRIEDLKAEIQEARDTIEEQEGVIESYEETAREQEDLEPLRKDLERKTSLLEQAAKEMEQFRELIQRRDGKLADQAQRMQNVQSDLQRARVEASNARQEAQRNEENVSVLEQTLVALRKEKDELAAKEIALQSDLTKEQEVQSRLRAELGIAEAESRERVREIQVLGQALAQERAKNARNVARFEGLISEMRSG